jgi:Ca2+-binding RTX toxin-like protein
VFAFTSWTLTANSEVEYVAASAAGAMNLTGNGLAQILAGNASSNQLSGGGGNDKLWGGAGDDSMAGGADNDIYAVNDAGDTVSEAGGGGSDTVFAFTSWTVTASSEVEYVAASAAGAMNLTGNGLAQILAGNGFGNLLAGAGGNDSLYASAGGDSLDGGADADSLFGGDDADDFIYDAVSDSTVALAGQDRIGDFSHAQGDRIDVSGIDAIAGGGEDAFSFVPGGAFTNVAGQLIARALSGTVYSVEGDIDGNGSADFAIRVVSATVLEQADFVL